MKNIVATVSSKNAGAEPSKPSSSMEEGGVEVCPLG